MSTALALLGGEKIRKEPFPAFNLIGEEERLAVDRVMRSGILSRYLGSWGDDFFGGPEVQAFEKEWSKHFGVKHTVAVNSNTSGLQTALGACGIGHGDEVIVTPYSICASASAPLVWNATPIFADIDPESYGISAAAIRKKITEKTKAILIVHLFGGPADMDEIMQIAKEKNLYVIEDCAQSPDATYKGKKVGSIGHIGVFSLNYHKHIHTGEGGMCTTNDDRLARKMQLIRNHAEAIVEGAQEEELENMLGFNFRLTEPQAAIGRAQLKKLPKEITTRQKYVKALNAVLQKYDFLHLQQFSDREPAYYVHPLQYDAEKSGVKRERFVQALRAELAPFAGLEHEGVPIGMGYVKPLYYLPMFQKKIAYKNGFPFSGKEEYAAGSCPVVEDMHFHKLITHRFAVSSLSESDFAQVIAAFQKVCENISKLRE